MSVASSQREGERSVAQVVAEWRERSARGEPIDAGEMLAEIEQAEQVAVRTDSLRASQFSTEAKGDTADQSKTPTVSLRHEAAALPSTPTGAFERAASRVKALLREDPGSGAKQYGLEDYDVLREIAKGGMGVVYEARQRSLNRIVALKMIKAGQLDNVEDVARFYAEAEAAANLRHPNIVAIYEVGRADSAQHYFTMDYVAGPSLLDVIRKQPLSAREAAAYVVKVARAIQFAHDRNVLHRDLKPSNILLGEDGEPRVTDFGLAKRIDQDARLTVAGAVVGTPAYMPPEQARGDTRQVGKAADIYSLGAVLYECVTGRPPFISSSLTEMLQQVLLDDPLPPSRLLPSLARDYETICLKCLEKEPERRYASAGELADDLERFLRDEPIRARPVSLPERALKFARRKPAWAAVWGVSAIAAAVLTVVVAAYTASLRETNLKLTKSEAEEKKQKNLAQANYDSLRTTSYATAIQKSEDYWADDRPNLARGDELLDSLIPRPGERDLRGIEWYFLKRLCQPTTPIHSDAFDIESLAVREDGSILVSDGRVKPVVAPYRDGKRVQFHEREQDNDVDQFFFARQGPWCAAACGSGELQLRQLQSPHEPGLVVAKNLDPGFLTAIADDGSLVAYTRPDNHLVIWSVAERRPIKFIPLKVSELKEIRFSPDNRWIMQQGLNEVIATDFEKKLNITYKTPGVNIVAAAAFSLDSRRLALAFEDATVTVYKFPESTKPELIAESTRPELTFTLLRFAVYPQVITFIPGGQRVAVGSINSLVVVMDLERKVPVVYRGHRAGIQCLAASPDGKWLYSGSTDGQVLAWDLSIEDQRARLIRDEQSGQYRMAFHALAYSPDGRWLACGGEIIPKEEGQPTGRLLIIDAATSKIAQRHDTPLPVRSVSFSPDSQRLVFGEASNRQPATFYLWDVSAHRLAGEVEPPDCPLHSAAFAADGRLVVGCADGTIRAQNAAGAFEVWKSRMPVVDQASKQIEALVSSADGRMVFSKNHGHLLRLWDVQQGQELFWSAGHAGRSAMTLSARCDLAAWTTHEDALRVTEPESPIVSSPEIRFAGPLAPHRRAILFDLKERRIRSIISGHIRQVHALAISDDAKRLASGDSAGIIKLWDTETGSELLSMDGHINGVRGIAFHPGGRQFASVGGDAVVRIWWTE